MKDVWYASNRRVDREDIYMTPNSRSEPPAINDQVICSYVEKMRKLLL
jgi:hypothetical protein